MTMQSRQNSYAPGGEQYRYAYNGMEQDEEVSDAGNSYTTEFRQYDPRLGRWKSLDPLMAKFPWQSPYCAFDDNPVLLIDPSGLASEGGGDDGGKHVIQKGETLSGIAKKYKTSIAKLVELNNIEDPNKIFAGETIFVPISDPETVGSMEESLASGIIDRYNGAQRAMNAEGGIVLTGDEKKLMTSSSDGTLNQVGNSVTEIIADQAVLDKYAPDVGDFFQQMVNTLPNSELTHLQDSRHRARQEVQRIGQGNSMMQIFSPDNVATILFMSLGSGGNSNTLRQSGYEFLKTRFRLFAIAEANAMMQLGNKGINGFAGHGAERAIERGFTNQNILTVVRSGKVVMATGRYGPQLRYTLNGNTVVVARTGRNAGKIITTFSNRTVDGVKGGWIH